MVLSYIVPLFFFFTLVLDSGNSYIAVSKLFYQRAEN